MATLSLGQTSSGAMSMARGVLCERMQQRAGCCSSMSGMLADSHGVGAASVMTQLRRSAIAGVGAKRVAVRRTTVAPACLAGEVGAARTREEDFVSMRSLAGFKDTADVLEWKGKASGRLEDAAAPNEWRFESESLIHGHVGKFAFLAILLMGVGVGFLTNAGDAEAATNHINSNGGLDVDMRALAMGPEGPLLEEFWDNMRRYGLYFFTVVTGGVYQLVKPFVDALKNPVTAILVVVIVTGSIYLVGLTVSAMLGINEYNYSQ